MARPRPMEPSAERADVLFFFLATRLILGGEFF